MRLTAAAANDLTNRFATQLAGGSIVIYAGPRPADMQVGLQRQLVRVTLNAPAFSLAKDGAAVGYPIPLGIIAEEGKATWAQFVTASGQVLADGTVGTDPTDDVVLTSTNLQRNGTVELTQFVLRLPMGS
jgi:ethanolamine utilization microcompartment shell protein EutL